MQVSYAARAPLPVCGDGGAPPASHPDNKTTKIAPSAIPAAGKPRKVPLIGLVPASLVADPTDAFRFTACLRLFSTFCLSALRTSPLGERKVSRQRSGDWSEATEGESWMPDPVAVRRPARAVGPYGRSARRGAGPAHPGPPAWGGDDVEPGRRPVHRLPRPPRARGAHRAGRCGPHPSPARIGATTTSAAGKR